MTKSERHLRSIATIERADRTTTPEHLISVITFYIQRLICQQSLVLTHSPFGIDCSLSDCKDTHTHSSELLFYKCLTCQTTVKTICKTMSQQIYIFKCLTLPFIWWQMTYIHIKTISLHSVFYIARQLMWTLLDKLQPGGTLPWNTHAAILYMCLLFF